MIDKTLQTHQLLLPGSRVDIFGHKHGLKEKKKLGMKGLRTSGALHLSDP